MQALTTAQVLALAPDPASAKAGQGLGNAAKWSGLGRDERSVWGECQGSALYRTQADLSGPAFHCSCPSRKFPCKHGLGLLLVLANSAGRVPAAPPPAWVEEWTKKRDASAQKKAAPPPDPSPAGPEAARKQDADRQKRAARREDRVRAGLAELQTWLGDLLRQGLASAKNHPARFYDAMAARMVDAQAPGLARRLRQWPTLFASGDGWADLALAEAGALQCLLDAAARADTLPAGLRASVRTAVGWSVGEQELLADPAAERVTDRWQVVGQRVEEEDRLRTQRTWLAGETTGRAALCLSFAAGAQGALDLSLVPGTAVSAELVFYPSAAPLRAFAGRREGDAKPFARPAACADFGEATNRAAALFAADPWLERVPWCVHGCMPARQGERWTLRDGAGASVPLAREFADPWPLAAVSGGAPVTVFGEWNGRALLPLGAFAEGRFVALGGGPRTA
ncbi:MAG: SWIM zinc finger family protein [Caulobacteraceae bacterium]|nr:SWIM zinc finger family protein [Caulobacter sp.]